MTVSHKAVSAQWSMAMAALTLLLASCVASAFAPHHNNHIHTNYNKNQYHVVVTNTVGGSMTTISRLAATPPVDEQADAWNSINETMDANDRKALETLQELRGAVQKLEQEMRQQVHVPPPATTTTTSSSNAQPVTTSSSNGGSYLDSIKPPATTTTSTSTIAPASASGGGPGTSYLASLTSSVSGAAKTTTSSSSSSSASSYLDSFAPASVTNKSKATAPPVKQGISGAVVANNPWSVPAYASPIAAKNVPPPPPPAAAAAATNAPWTDRNTSVDVNPDVPAFQSPIQQGSTSAPVNTWSGFPSSSSGSGADTGVRSVHVDPDGPASFASPIREGSTSAPKWSGFPSSSSRNGADATSGARSVQVDPDGPASFASPIREGSTSVPAGGGNAPKWSGFSSSSSGSGANSGARSVQVDPDVPAFSSPIRDGSTSVPSGGGAAKWSGFPSSGSGISSGVDFNSGARSIQVDPDVPAFASPIQEGNTSVPSDMGDGSHSVSLSTPSTTSSYGGSSVTVNPDLPAFSSPITDRSKPSTLLPTETPTSASDFVQRGITVDADIPPPFSSPISKGSSSVPDGSSALWSTPSTGGVPVDTKAENPGFSSPITKGSSTVPEGSSASWTTPAWAITTGGAPADTTAENPGFSSPITQGSSMVPEGSSASWTTPAWATTTGGAPADTTAENPGFSSPITQGSSFVPEGSPASLYTPSWAAATGGAPVDSKGRPFSSPITKGSLSVPEGSSASWSTPTWATSTGGAPVDPDLPIFSSPISRKEFPPSIPGSAQPTNSGTTGRAENSGGYTVRLSPPSDYRPAQTPTVPESTYDSFAAIPSSPEEYDPTLPADETTSMEPESPSYEIPEANEPQMPASRATSTSHHFDPHERRLASPTHTYSSTPSEDPPSSRQPSVRRSPSYNLNRVYHNSPDTPKIASPIEAKSEPPPPAASNAGAAKSSTHGVPSNPTDIPPSSRPASIRRSPSYTLNRVYHNSPDTPKIASPIEAKTPLIPSTRHQPMETRPSSPETPKRNIPHHNDPNKPRISSPIEAKSTFLSNNQPSSSSAPPFFFATKKSVPHHNDPRSPRISSPIESKSFPPSVPHKSPQTAKDFLATERAALAAKSSLSSPADAAAKNLRPYRQPISKAPTRFMNDPQKKISDSPITDRSVPSTPAANPPQPKPAARKFQKPPPYEPHLVKYRTSKQAATKSSGPRDSSNEGIIET